MGITREQVNNWLIEYVAAWKSYDPEAIGALFSEDVAYRYHPWDEPVRGRSAVVEAWLGEADHEDASTPDEPDTYEGAYQVVAVDGEVAVATGSSEYAAEPGGPVNEIYDNCYVMRFDAEGRCSEFTEWYMLRRES